jgi:hypothetical protein
MRNYSAISSSEQAVAPASASNIMSGSEGVQYEGQRYPATAVQCKLSVGAADDPMELEAETMADKVMRMPEPFSVQRKCAHCEEEEEVQRKPLASFIQKKGNDGGTIASDAVTNKINATRGSGNNMDKGTKTFMESRFGADFSNVKIHTGNDAVQMSRELNAQAFTVGNDIYFNEGKYNPGSSGGKHLLAHELTHTVQQGNGDLNRKMIQRFESSERPQIGTLETIIAQARTFAENASTTEGFVEQAGGSSVRTVAAGVSDATSGLGRGMTSRYLITCRCGMVDMRHFYQLMYIASKFTNRRATSMGRDHELEAEATSRFAAEDTTSNALGAYFGANNFDMFYTSVDTFIDRLNTFLTRCAPVDFSALPAPEQDVIVNFYAQRDAAGVPVNQSEVATPARLNISVCNGRHRSFPFVVDPAERRTITSEAFTHGTSSIDSDDGVRDFVSTQLPETIRSVSTSEKVRLVSLLLSGWVADEDLDALQTIVSNSGSEQLEAIRGSVRPTSLSSISQRTRLRTMLNL